MRIDSRHDAPIVVDLQPDFMPGGPLAVADGDRVAAPIGRLASRFSTVVATQDWHPAGPVSFTARGGLWPAHCLAGSPAAHLHAAFPDELVTLILRKGTGSTSTPTAPSTTPSCAAPPQLRAVLRAGSPPLWSLVASEGLVAEVEELMKETQT